jgi:hypothetical protein
MEQRDLHNLDQQKDIRQEIGLKTDKTAMPHSTSLTSNIERSKRKPCDQDYDPFANEENIKLLSLRIMHQVLSL